MATPIVLVKPKTNDNTVSGVGEGGLGLGGGRGGGGRGGSGEGGLGLGGGEGGDGDGGRGLGLGDGDGGRGGPGGEGGGGIETFQTLPSDAWLKTYEPSGPTETDCGELMVVPEGDPENNIISTDM